MVTRPGKLVGLGGMLLLVAGCGLDSSPAVSLPSARPVYPSKNVVSALKKMSLATLISQNAWHELQGLPFGENISSINSGQLLLSVFPPGPGQLSSAKWPDGLYLINAKTDRVDRVLRLPNTLKPSEAVVSGSWLAYEAADSLSGNYRTVDIKNIVTGQQRIMFTLPENVYSTGDVSGLSIHHDTVYWLTNALYPNGMSSTVYAYNLSTQKLRMVLREDPKGDNRMFFAMQATSSGLWLSVNDSGNLKSTTAPGSLWFWSYAKQRVIHHVSVYHAPTLLYGGVPGGVVFSGDYTRAPGSPINPAPYPVFVDRYRQHQVSQITPADNPGGETTVDGSFVAIDGVGANGEVINTQQNSVTTVPSPRVVVSGGYLVIERTQSLQWAPLPTGITGSN